MEIKIPEVDAYLSDGCGRCKYYNTPQCKVHRWNGELKALREIVLDCGLKEELKWSQPCYTYQNKNILIVSAFKEYCALNFFKGALLNDCHKILTQPTNNSRESRQVRFVSTDRIAELKPILKEYILEAVEIEKSGKQIHKSKPEDFPYPEELLEKFNEDYAFREAFDALTPGRQKSYLLHFASAKQAATRISRIEKCIPKIFDGLGFNER